MFLNPEPTQVTSLRQNTRFDVQLVQKTVHGIDQGTIPTNTKMATAAMLNFPFLFLSTLHFWGSALDSAWQISCWSDSRFKSYYPGSILVFIGNALTVPPKWGFGDFRGENWNIYLPKPQKATPYGQNTRSDVSLAKIGPRVWPGHYPEEQTKLWCRRPSLIFNFLIFEHTTLLGGRS